MAPPKYTLLECIKKVIIASYKYPFSYFLFGLVIFTLLLIVFNKKIKSEAFKYIATLSWIAVAIATGIKYSMSVKFLQQTLKSKTFTAIYFPNVVTYIVMLLISILIFFFAIVKKEKSTVIKLINYTCFGVIWVNFILILREVFKREITIYDPLTIFKYETLQVLIQTSTWIFVLWLIALFINYLSKNVTNKLDNLAKKNHL